MMAQCWKKMHQQIIHPSSQGFIQTLGRVTKNELEVGFNIYMATGVGKHLSQRNDLMLGGLLIKMHE